jgi:hypothetical protein
MQGPKRRRRHGRLGAAGLVCLVAVACGHGSVTIHGTVSKRVGRSCDLLSAAFPSVAGRQVSFVDQTGATIGRTVSGAEHLRDAAGGACVMSSAFRLTLPSRASYSATVSSQVTEIASAPPIDYDRLAANGWRFDITIPETA